MTEPPKHGYLVLVERRRLRSTVPDDGRRTDIVPVLADGPDTARGLALRYASKAWGWQTSAVGGDNRAEVTVASSVMCCPDHWIMDTEKVARLREQFMEMGRAA